MIAYLIEHCIPHSCAEFARLSAEWNSFDQLKSPSNWIMSLFLIDILFVLLQALIINYWLSLSQNTHCLSVGNNSRNIKQEGRYPAILCVWLISASCKLMLATIQIWDTKTPPTNLRGFDVDRRIETIHEHITIWFNTTLLIEETVKNGRNREYQSIRSPYFPTNSSEPQSAVIP